jgi:putative transposase
MEIKKLVSDVTKKRTVELVSFCLMPNHFHLIVKAIDENGIPRYMQRVLNSYTKYINTKYDKTGHMFQGPYKAVYIKDDRQLLYLSAYIHKNPREIKEWSEAEHEYPWSSYPDFIGQNRFANLIIPDIIDQQFKNKKEYFDFVKTSSAKILQNEIDN